jgi:hypothetical protein
MTEQEEDAKIPVDFICPITKCLMSDPVICEDGHTYDRPAISFWLTRHHTSPMTGKELESKKLIPVFALKNAIESIIPELVRLAHKKDTPDYDVPDTSGIRTLEPFYVNQWLDVLDTDGKWLEARIMLIPSTRTIKIHYKGWKEKYDEILHIINDRDRIALLHQHTLCPSQPSYFVPSNFDIGTELDVLDQQNKWQIGVIENFDPTTQMVFIKYIGWSNKFNEWINIESYRLTECGSHNLFSCEAGMKCAMSNDPSHCIDQSHPCGLGLDCPLQDDIDHASYFVHANG